MVAGGVGLEPSIPGGPVARAEAPAVGESVGRRASRSDHHLGRIGAQKPEQSAPVIGSRPDRRADEGGILDRPVFRPVRPLHEGFPPGQGAAERVAPGGIGLSGDVGRANRGVGGQRRRGHRVGEDDRPLGDRLRQRPGQGAVALGGRGALGGHPRGEIREVSKAVHGQPHRDHPHRSQEKEPDPGKPFRSGQAAGRPLTFGDQEEGEREQPGNKMNHGPQVSLQPGRDPGVVAQEKGGRGEGDQVVGAHLLPGEAQEDHRARAGQDRRRFHRAAVRGGIEDPAPGPQDQQPLGGNLERNQRPQGGRAQGQVESGQHQGGDPQHQ